MSKAIRIALPELRCGCTVRSEENCLELRTFGFNPSLSAVKTGSQRSVHVSKILARSIKRPLQTQSPMHPSEQGAGLFWLSSVGCPQPQQLPDCATCDAEEDDSLPSPQQSGQIKMPSITAYTVKLRNIVKAQFGQTSGSTLVKQ